MPSPIAWTDHDPILAAMWRAGATDTEIAAKIGRSVRAVAERRSRLGLVKRKLQRESSATKMHANTMITELRRRGYTVYAPDGDEAIGIDPRSFGPAHSGGMLL